MKQVQISCCRYQKKYRRIGVYIPHTVSQPCIDCINKLYRGFHERLLSSKNKEQVAAEIQTLETAKSPEDVIRDPYVLEFLGLTPNDDFYESDLEQALISVC